MKKLMLLIFLLMFFCLKNYSQNKQESPKPVYVGHIEYTKGNFGTYNYPVKGDSILVYLDDKQQITFKILSPKGLTRDLELNLADLKLIKKQVFENIIAIDKVIPTGNYDMKFSNDNKSNTFYTVYLTHFGDGNMAELTVLGEDNGSRADDLFVAELVKSK